MPKRVTRFRDTVEVHINAVTDDGRIKYRAELWVRPFSGYILASTRWVKTNQLAVRDGARVFNPAALRQWTK